VETIAKVAAAEPDVAFSLQRPKFALGREGGNAVFSISADGKAYGRPVGVAEDQTGALLVADDVGNTVWRVVPAD